ncbi:MAG: hypothetical protein ABSA57_20260 [Candidatus Acidiferrales bacterium]
MKEFGIYIMTHPGDFHLSSSLICSIRHFHPDIPIMIIPGENFDRQDHPFDIDIMPEPKGFWRELGHHDRDFWAFQGPFERFLYLDADIICTGSLSSLFRRIRNQEGPFIFVHVYLNDQTTWEASIENKNHPRHEEAKAWVKRGLGNPDLLARFDAAYSPYGRVPFNSGIFASRREAISESDLRTLHEREVSFYADILNQPFTWKSCDLFVTDQGRLNYLVDKLSIPIIDLRPDGHDIWAGDIIEKVTVDRLRNDKLEFKFIHWAGVPRPSPSIFSNPYLHWLNPLIYRFNDYKKYEGFPQIPGYALWRYFQVDKEYAMRINDQLSWTYSDLKRLTRSIKSKLKMLLPQ